MEQNLNLTSDDGELLKGPPLYSRLIGRLIDLILTKPDLSYSVHKLCQFMDNQKSLIFLGCCNS